MSDVCLPVWAVVAIASGPTTLAGLIGWQAEPPDVVEPGGQ